MFIPYTPEEFRSNFLDSRLKIDADLLLFQKLEIPHFLIQLVSFYLNVVNSNREAEYKNLYESGPLHNENIVSNKLRPQLEEEKLITKELRKYLL
jgi:hypothetical protein